MDETAWAGSPKNGKAKNDINRNIASKTEFLAGYIPPRRSHDGSYAEAFKIKMVSLAINGTRAFVRKKFNIPETTLRGWIKAHQKRSTYETRRILTESQTTGN